MNRRSAEKKYTIHYTMAGRLLAGDAIEVVWTITMKSSANICRPSYSVWDA